MTILSHDTLAGADIIDDFIDASSTLVTIPHDLDPKALAYVAQLQADARKAVERAVDDCKHSIADAEYRTLELVAADFDRLQAGYVCRRGTAKALLMAPGAAAARVRSMAALLAKRAA